MLRLSSVKARSSRFGEHGPDVGARLRPSARADFVDDPQGARSINACRERRKTEGP
jgi:hypothetical protein